jgi:hypothetical protein
MPIKMHSVVGVGKSLVLKVKYNLVPKYFVV